MDHTSPPALRRKPAGFTLVEIMIVVAIIALLASMALPVFQRARMRAQATLILEELRTLEAALEQYTHETSLPGGTEVAFEQLRPYLKEGSSLYETGSDLVGNPHGPFVVNTIPAVNPSTYEAFTLVADETFWNPYFRESDP